MHDINVFSNRLALVGIKTFYYTRDPTTADNTFRIPSLWINTASLTSWIMIDNTGGSATWTEVGALGAPTHFIDFYDATAAPPGAPTALDSYVLDTGTPVNAAWTALGATNDDYVVWSGTAWSVRTPNQGDVLYNETETDFYIYTGSAWELLSTTISGLVYTEQTRMPRTTDNTYVVPTLWLDTTANKSWLLVDITGGVATWLKMGASTLGDAQDSVLGRTDGNNAPPMETTGDRYIIYDGGGGVVHANWDGASFNDICTFDGATWVTLTPNEGTFTEVEDEDTVYIFITAWEKLFESTGAVFGTDSGTATPDATGALNIIGNGTQGVSTSGATNNVTVTVADASSTQKGVQENATGAEAVAGSSNTHTITPFGLETKLGSITLNSVIIGGGATQQLKATAALTDGQIVIGSTGNTPVASTLTEGEAIDFVNAAGSITISCEDASTTNKGVAELATDAEAIPLDDTTRIITGANLAAVMLPMRMSGFYSWDGAGAYYSVTGTDVTLLRAGTGYINNKEVKWAGSQTTGSLTKGNTYYLYIDSSGTLQTTTTANLALFQDNIVLFEAWVDNAGTPNVLVVKENHPVDYQSHVSKDLHDTIHVVLEGTGAVIAAAGGDGLQIIGEDELHDHGLETDIPDSSGAAVTWDFCNTDGTGKWLLDSTGTSFPSEYNNAGTMTALGAGKYGVWRCYVSKDDLNDSTPTYFAVAGTAQYNNLVTARAAITAGMAQATSELAQLELAQLGYAIYDESTSSITEVIVARSVIGNVSTGAITQSAALITVDTSLFDGWLDSGDSNSQNCFNSIDELAKDGTFHLENTADGTKRMLFDLSGITTGNDRTITMADQAVDLTPTTGTYQGADAGLTDIAALAVTDGNIIVGNGTNWVAESGATARTSLGLGTSDTVQFQELGLGTATVPHGAVGGGLVAIEGADSAIATGPHVQYTTASDDYPLMQLLPWAHDNIRQYWDSYFDGSNDKSSDAGSNFRIRKQADVLRFEVATGFAQGATITGWDEGILISANAQVSMPDQAAFKAVRASSDVSNVTGNATNYTIIFNSESWDIGSVYNTSTGIFTAPYSGKYTFDVNTFTFGHTGSGTRFNTIIRTSGGTSLINLIFVNPSNIKNPSGQISIGKGFTLDLAASDTIRVDIYVEGEASDVVDLAASAATFFEGRYLGT